MIYLDTAALLKLVHREAESTALRAWLAANPGDLTSSALVRTESRRALLRNDPAALTTLPRILAAIAQIPISEGILDRAAALPDPMLRTLDAIHLASAATIPTLDWFLTYDKRLVSAAVDHGLRVESPA
jgi:predicted nucleic acid-binding protein